MDNSSSDFFGDISVSQEELMAAAAASMRILLADVTEDDHGGDVGMRLYNMETGQLRKLAEWLGQCPPAEYCRDMLFASAGYAFNATCDAARDAAKAAVLSAYEVVMEGRPLPEDDPEVDYGDGWAPREYEIYRRGNEGGQLAYLAGQAASRRKGREIVALIETLVARDGQTA